MARIKYTALVESIRGTIAGTTFQRNAYGYTVKAKPNMLNPSTNLQLAQQAQMTRIAQAWRSLSDANRSTWNTYAENNPRPSRLNPDSYLSGYNLFLLYHRYNQFITNTILASPSLDLDDAGAIEYILYLDGTALTWETNPTGMTGTWGAILYLTAIIPLGREYINYTPRFITIGTYSSAMAFDLGDKYIDLFGANPADSQWVGMKIVLVNQVTAQVIVGPEVQIQVLTI